MSKKRTLIVGDIHGCFDEFMELLEKASYDKSRDRLILLGDLINKGPKSMEVLNWVKKNQIETLMGNHELGFINYMNSPNPKYKNFEKLSKEMGEKAGKWHEWMGQLPLYIEEENFIAVHGGIVPGFDYKKTPAHLMTRIRTWDGKGEDMYNKDDPPWYDFYKEEKLVVYGHWAGQGLKVRDNTIGIDTGCCFGRQLTILHLEKRDFFQINAKDEYTKW